VFTAHSSNVALFFCSDDHSALSVMSLLAILDLFRDFGNNISHRLYFPIDDSIILRERSDSMVSLTVRTSVRSTPYMLQWLHCCAWSELPPAAHAAPREFCCWLWLRTGLAVRDLTGGVLSIFTVLNLFAASLPPYRLHGVSGKTSS